MINGFILSTGLESLFGGLNFKNFENRIIIKTTHNFQLIMKNFLIPFLLLSPAISRAQFFVNMGAGVATFQTFIPRNEVDRPEVKKNMAPVVKISAGYQIKNIVLETEERPTITREVNAPNFFGAKAGYNIRGFVPAAGYYFNLKNEDNPENNSSSFGYSLKYQVMISENGGLYAEGVMIDKSYQFTAGFQIQF